MQVLLRFNMRHPADDSGQEFRWRLELRPSTMSWARSETSGRRGGPRTARQTRRGPIRTEVNPSELTRALWRIMLGDFGVPLKGR
jgi:hypothetical protein